jgi:uncharacterized protein
MVELRQPPAIEAYGRDGFRIEGARYEGAVLILADQVSQWSGAWTVESVAPVLSAPRADVEFLILGSGAQLQPPPAPLREALRVAGLGLEVLTTPEAARLYNLLARDGRRVAAALRPA